MKSDEFFESRKEWSRRKHRILAKYLPPFTAKLGSWNPVVYCIDGFAGVGRYDDGTEGSPLISARATDEAASWSTPATLRVINVEAKPAHFRELARHTAPWAEHGAVLNLNARFGEVVPDVLRRIGDAPALFFIDPYGPSKVPFDCLRPILSRQVRQTEFIINFNLTGLRRLADRIQQNTKTVRGRKSASTTISLVNRIQGDARWQQMIDIENMPSQAREDILFREYKKKLAAFGYQVFSYPIREALHTPPKYHLILCTRHIDGARLWNNFVCEEENKLIEESVSERPGETPSLFAEMVVPDAKNDRIRRLAPLVEDYLASNRTTTRGALIAHFVKERFGEFHEKDYREAVKELLGTGAVKSATGRKQINDEVRLSYGG